MFLSHNYLNEGGTDESRLESRKKELYEGENPKSNISNSNPTGWQSTKERSHVNSNWQKLRK